MGLSQAMALILFTLALIVATVAEKKWVKGWEPKPLLGWPQFADLIKQDMSVRLFLHADTNADGHLSESEFRRVSGSTLVYQLLLNQDKQLSPTDLELSLAAIKLLDKVVLFDAIKKRTMALNTELTFEALRDRQVNCTLDHILSPFKRIKQDLTPEPDDASVSGIGIMDLAASVARILGVDKDTALGLVLQSKDVDRAGTKSMRISGRGACMFLAKHYCRRELTSPDLPGPSRAPDVWGLPGLAQGHLLDVIRGDVVVENGKHLAGPVAPAVPVAAVARFISSSLQLLDASTAQTIASTVDCSGSGKLDADSVALAIAVAYSELRSRLPQPLESEVEIDV